MPLKTFTPMVLRNSWTSLILSNQKPLKNMPHFSLITCCEVREVHIEIPFKRIAPAKRSENWYFCLVFLLHDLFTYLCFLFEELQIICSFNFIKLLICILNSNLIFGTSRKIFSFMANTHICAIILF